VSVVETMWCMLLIEVRETLPECQNQVVEIKTNRYTVEMRFQSWLEGDGVEKRCAMDSDQH
jgi:hypothetical protein